MIHVRQRGPLDCGVAVAAMVTGERYEQVLDRWFGCLTVEDGLREIAFWRVLQDITQVEWQISGLREPWPLVGEYAFPATPGAAIIHGPSWRHYIAVQGRNVLDPLLELPMDQIDYPNRGWRVQTIFKRTEVAIGAGLR